MKPNNYRKVVCLSFLIINILVKNKTFAQNPTNPNATNIEFDLKKTLPTSPEAAMLGKFGDVPIGYYTGTADVSIPLYAIKAGDLSLPITLSYHNSGVKVEDEATWVGLGWNLDPGGAVIKIINGMDDDKDSFVTVDPTGYQYLFNRSITGSYSTTAEIGNLTWSCSPGQMVPTREGDTQAILGALTQEEGQPDLYQYNLPGGFSGKFYINPKSHQPILIDKKDSVKFDFTDGLVATTLNGNKYYFSAIENSFTDVLSDYSGQTWKLSKIVLNNGKVISFSYYNGGYSGMVYSETYHDQYANQPVQVNDLGIVKHSDLTQSSTQILTQIKTDDIIINFNLEDRQDISASNVGNGQLLPKRLKSIDIISPVTNTILKTYNFNYSYFTSSTDPSYTYISNFSNQQTFMAYSSLRLKLDSVREVGYNAQSQPINNPAYKFTYNTAITLPAKASYSRDFWGYYNGKVNNNLMPDLKYFYYSDFDNYKNVMTSGTINAYSGANRTTDTSKMMAGMLTSIQYPTGGRTAFQYQSNDFSNYYYPDISVINASSSTIYAEDQNNPNDRKSIDFTLTANQIIQFSNYIQSGPPNPANNFDSLLPSTVTLSNTVNGVKTIVRQWAMTTEQRQQFADNGGVISWINDTVSLQANILYNIAVELPDALGAQNTSMAQASVISTFQYYNPTSNISKISYGGGVRVSAITNYDKTGAIINNKIIKYINADGSTSGKLMSHLAFLYNKTILSSILSGSYLTSNYILWVSPIWYISSQSFIPYSTSAGGNLVGYSRVEEINTGPNSTTNGKHIYYYNNGESNTRVNSPDIPNPFNGLLSKEVFFKSNEDTVKEIDYVYGDHNPAAGYSMGISYTGAKIFSNFVGVDPCSSAYDYETLPAKYEIDFYPINSWWILLNSKQTKDYNNGKTVSSTEGYVYNIMGQLVRDSITNSRGEVLTTYNKYPVDIPLAQRTPIQQSLIDSSFYNNILEQHQLNNEIENSQAKVFYAIKSNQLVKSEIDKSFNGNPLFTDWTFDAYGPNKTLQQASDKGIQSSAFIYDQNNTYILADVKNAAITDIAYSSFESNQPGNWSLGSTARNSTGFSGFQSYALSGSNTLSKSGLSASKTYIVSYWTTNSSSLTIAGTIAGYPIKGATISGWTYYEHLVTGQTTVTLSGTGNIDEVRLYPNNAEMTTWTYNPLIGISSTVGPKNQISYYEYDSFQRLLNIKDKDGNVIKHYSYHYQGQ